MSDFVAECRREWKRLRVPDSVADEMAAELAADLSEAAAEGVSAEEVLGAGGADPRAFAASWAAERGVIPRRPRVGALVLAAVAVLSVAALSAGVAILATPPDTTSAVPARSVVFSPDGRLWTSTGADGRTIVMPMSRTPVVRFADRSTVSIQGDARRWAEVGQGTSTDVIAWALIVAGIVGIVLTTLGWLGRGRLRDGLAV